jgi:hypothetical protein
MITERFLTGKLSNPSAAYAAGVFGIACSPRSSRTRYRFQAPATHVRRRGWNLSQLSENAKGTDQ